MKRIGGYLVQLSRRMTLFQKMLSFYLVMLCIPTVLIGTFYIGNLRRRLDEEYVSGKQRLLDQSVRTIENGLTRVAFCTSSFQYNSSLLLYVESYDFTTGTGAETWLQSVRTAFQQLEFANQDFTKICIWRMKNQLMNDPRYVLNSTDNPDMEKLEPMDYKTMQVIFQNEGEQTECRIYKGLFNVTRFNQVGYVEVDCDFSVLFSALNFAGKGEVLLLTQADQVYQVRVDESGRPYLSEAAAMPADKSNRLSAQIETLKLQMDYYYKDFAALSNVTLMTMCIGLLLLFFFFTALYYAFYLSMARRIQNLTVHMEQNFGGRMLPYKEDPSGDEIGTLVRGYNGMVGRINALNDEILTKERLANQAQYYAIQSQIHPHFLYNTLENIDMLIEIGENEKASRMMAAFGKMLRYNLSRRREMSTVEEEVSHAEDYLKLYSYRMREDFSWRIEIAPECKGTICPYCMLQPVVENCFKHGFLEMDRAFWVHIRAWSKNGAIWIEVEDNGAGITKERLEEVEDKLRGQGAGAEEESSVGLANVHERILLLCGKGSGLWIYPRQQGCLVRIVIQN